MIAGYPEQELFLLQHMTDRVPRVPAPGLVIGRSLEAEFLEAHALGVGACPRRRVVTGDVILSSGVNIWFASVVRGDLARITLGARVNIQDGCVVHTDYDLAMDVDEGVVVGHGAVLHGRSIGRNTLIGIGARLLSG